MSRRETADPGSYRVKAGSSLNLKVFEMVDLLSWGDLLSSDSLQFGYKAKTSTTQCTWLVSEVVQLMQRNGINTILTVLKCSKAFGKCKFSILFSATCRQVFHLYVAALILISLKSLKCRKSGFRYHRNQRNGVVPLTALIPNGALSDRYKADSYPCP